jgi:hypothetical protein
MRPAGLRPAVVTVRAEGTAKPRKAAEKASSLRCINLLDDWLSGFVAVLLAATHTRVRSAHAGRGELCDHLHWFARALPTGAYTATYVARATAAGRFIRPPSRAEEMYNAATSGRSEGGIFVVTPKSR